MSESTPSFCTPQVQVLFHPTTGDFFIREDGRTCPASQSHVAGRFGPLFAAAVAAMSGMWITFDDDARADVERIEANRQRYEPVGVTDRLEITGANLFGVFDHVQACLMPYVLLSFDAAVHQVDQINAPQDTWPYIRHADGSVSIDPNGGSLGAACPVCQRVAEHRVDAVNAILDVINQPHPAA